MKGRNAEEMENVEKLQTALAVKNRKQAKRLEVDDVINKKVDFFQDIFKVLCLIVKEDVIEERINEIIEKGDIYVL